MNEELLKRIEELERKLTSLESSSTIPFNVDRAFRDRLRGLVELPVGFEDAPLASITAPTGGATQDAEARSAVNTLITRLEDLGLILPN